MEPRATLSRACGSSWTIGRRCASVRAWGSTSTISSMRWRRARVGTTRSSCSRVRCGTSLTSVARSGRMEMANRRIPVRVLNRLWHRLAWPPVESRSWVGRSTSPTRPIRCCCRAGTRRASSPSTTSTSSRTPSGRAARSGGTTRSSCRHTPTGPTTSSSARRTPPAKSTSGWGCLAPRSACAGPARPPGSRERRRRRPARSCLSARSSPARTSAACSTPTRASSRAVPTHRSSSSWVAPRRPPLRGLHGLGTPRCRDTSATWATWMTRCARASTSEHDCSCCPRSTRGSACPSSRP